MPVKPKSVCETCGHYSASDFLYPGCQLVGQACRYEPRGVELSVCMDGQDCPKREACERWLGGGQGVQFYRLYGPECPMEWWPEE